MNQASTVSFVVGALSLFVANGISNAMRRLVYGRSGRTFRVFSMQLVRDYRALYGPGSKLLGLLLILAGIRGWAGGIRPLFRSRTRFDVVLSEMAIYRSLSSFSSPRRK